ncbi:MAG: hypothetical protein RLN85_03375, partial [Pseudomonadales bacterium]
ACRWKNTGQGSWKNRAERSNGSRGNPGFFLCRVALPCFSSSPQSGKPRIRSFVPNIRHRRAQPCNPCRDRASARSLNWRMGNGMDAMVGPWHDGGSGEG